MNKSDFYMLKLNAYGTTEIVTTKKRPELQQLYDLIGCDCIENVYLKNGYLMIVDESGWLKEDPVPNFNASILYSGTVASIAGIAVLLKLDRRSSDWKALTYEEAVGLRIEIEARTEAYIQNELMQI